MDYLIYNLAAPHLHALADTSLLSEDEREAAEKRGKRYILTRCLLRRELGRRLDCPAADISLRYSEQGKPECVGTSTPIHFNISHSGDCLAMAFDTQAPIGIDVERIRPRARLAQLAARIMCPEQLAAYQQRGCPTDEFYTCWCAAEALVKQAAGSIWQAKEHAFVCEHGRIRLLPLPATNARPLLTVHPFTPMPGYRGVVVCHTSAMREEAPIRLPVLQ